MQQINERPQIVAEYESGKAIPNQNILQKMEKALQIKLRGKDIGEPLQKPKPKAESRPASAASSKVSASVVEGFACCFLAQRAACCFTFTCFLQGKGKK